MTKGLKKIYNYGDETNVSITDLLKRKEIVNFLERGKRLTYPSLRDKLRFLLGEHRENLKNLVDEYNAEHPPSQEERVLDTDYGAQRRRKNLPLKDNKGNPMQGPRKFLSPPREPRKVIPGKGKARKFGKQQGPKLPNANGEPSSFPNVRRTRRIGVIHINGKNYTARQAFEKFPQLRGYYHVNAKKMLKDSTLHAKLRKDARNDRLPNDILDENLPEFQQIEDHFDGVKITYKLEDPRIKYHNVPSLFDYLKPQILEMIRTHPNTKIGLSLHVWMLKRTGKELRKEKKGLHSGARFENYEGTNPENIFNTLREIIYEQLQRLEDVEGSGWALVSIDHVLMSFVKISPIVGSSYKPLPKELGERRENGIDNIDNSKGGCQQCFKWAETRSRFPPKKKPEKRRNIVTEQLRNQSENLNWDGIHFPTPLHEIDIFDNLNETSTMVLGWDDNKKRVIYLRLPKKKFKRTSQLFYHDKHYDSVRDLSKLMRPYFHDNAGHFCHYCTFWNRSETVVKSHMEMCQMDKITVEKLPEPGTFVEFQHHHEKEFKPFVIMADFESKLEKVYEKKGDKTEFIQHHKPSGYCYHLTSRLESTPNCTKKYTAKTENSDVSFHFFDSVTSLVKKIGKQYKDDKEMNLSEEEESNFQNATTCWMCEKPFDDLEKNWKVRDHCHYTGKYRGPAHNLCNLKMRKDKTVVVGFHNGTNYDFHLFVKDLGRHAGKINVIAKNSEKYISVEKSIIVGEEEMLDEEGNPVIDKKTKKPKKKLDIWKIRFVDSCGILQGSLSELVKNLPRDQFKVLRQRFPRDEEFNLVMRKGVFPYEWFDSIEKLEETKLPPRKDFYSSLTCEDISKEDYLHAQKVWKTFKFKTMRDYHDFYCEIDVLQLSDVFENLRDRLMGVFGLDVAHSYTLPGFSWKAALKYTKQRLGLISDSEMYEFVERAKRGGISTVTHRYAKANNVYMGKDFDPNEPSKFLEYLDANNLYGGSMSQPLPTGNFGWADGEELNFIPLEELPPCFVEVDLEYPVELHDYFSDFVPAPDYVRPEGSKVKKLAPNLYPKTKYVCHFRNLILYRDLGVKITKIHRALSFDESPWLKPYIDLNTTLRAKATNDADKNMHKLLNNAVFGKTCENLRERTDYRLVTTQKEALKLAAKPTFKDYTVLDGQLAGIHLDPSVVKLNKPSYVGVAVLDLSKLHMYNFFYNYLKPKYGNDMKLLMTDTDSLFLEIRTENFYDIRADVPEWFDTSGYPTDHPSKLPRMNKEVIGMFKDELDGKTALEFCGTAAKSYAFTILEKNETKKKCKGIRKAFVKKELTIDDYKNCVLDEKQKTVKQTQFRSYDHEMFTERITKIALSPYDDKRVIATSGVKTLPLGHWKAKHPVLQDCQNLNVNNVFEKGTLMNLAYEAIKG